MWSPRGQGIECPTCKGKGNDGQPPYYGMSRASERHLALLAMALKRGLAGPVDKRPVLSPTVLECLREGAWEGVAIGILHDLVEGNRVLLTSEAVQHLVAWADTSDVTRDVVVQDLIVRFNAAAFRLDREWDWLNRRPNRAERRAAKRKKVV